MHPTQLSVLFFVVVAIDFTALHLNNQVYDTARAHAIMKDADEFYGTMPSIEGAIEALKEMDKHPQIIVRICT